MLDLALRCRFAIIRQCAARCFATICNVMTLEAMRYVVEHLIPLLGDALVLVNRQGAVELIYRSCIDLCRLFEINTIVDIVQRLDLKALPYVIFMIVPVLGRMSDSDDDIRSIATNTFAALVKMVPLEVSDFFRAQPAVPDTKTRLVSLTLRDSRRSCSSVAKTSVNS